MHIICPNCSTSYAIDPAQLGPGGRNVRCSRCKDTWHVRVEDVVSIEAMEEATAGPGLAEQTYAARAQADDAQDRQQNDLPVIESPSISAAVDKDDREAFQSRFGAKTRPMSAVRGRLAPLTARLTFLSKLPRSIAIPKVVRSYATLPVACVAMAALSLGLIVWRSDVVRLMPQTAAMFKLVGLEVNLRGLQIENVRVMTETIDGKPAYIIEGAVRGVSSKPVTVPRLRFVVHDEKGTEIYGWTSVLEQTSAQPGERISFRTRLASPPVEAREIAVRFFSRRDIGA